MNTNKHLRLFAIAALTLCQVSIFASVPTSSARTIPDAASVKRISPDSTLVAFVYKGDLWVAPYRPDHSATSCCPGAVRITDDGSETIMNGYASWVYYEEIFGRPDDYAALWWSPDSRRIGFYRFDDSDVTMFLIYSPFATAAAANSSVDSHSTGAAGSLRRTRYPLAGEINPSVKVGIANLVFAPSAPGNCASISNTATASASGSPSCCSGADSFAVSGAELVWADFDYSLDQYFGIPFWSPDSREFFIAREPRRQNCLDLYAVDATTGGMRGVYHEEYPTWVNWIEEVIFTDKGLYMARDFESGWQQIYFLSYDGKTFRRLSDGENWDIHLVKVDDRKGDVWFTAKRDSRIHAALYRLDRRGRITTLTDPELNVAKTEVSGSGRTEIIRVTLSSARHPYRTVDVPLYAKAPVSYDSGELVARLNKIDPAEVEAGEWPVPQIVRIQNDGFDLYALISVPRNFDPGRRYPVVMQLYGGPGTPYVRDSWYNRDAFDKWCFDNGVIYIVVDPRSSGENGRRGMDQAFRRMTVVELGDYLAWARWLESLPYVRRGRIGVEGFSFGGTTTAMLVLRYPEHFRCGIAGGGVYDWHLYDSHYTERFMDTPQNNPDGYDEACVLEFVPKVFDDTCNNIKPLPGALKITHGTGDDNVHLQNSLLLTDALQRCGYQFELMLYPDGMHGYRGYQGTHSLDSDHAFWTRWLLD